MVLAALTTFTACAQVKNSIDFFSMTSKLKTTKRTGWVNHKVKEPESIADHMYRMAMMAFVAAEEEGLDPARCMQIALAHDLAEMVVGDITPHDGVSKVSLTIVMESPQSSPPIDSAHLALCKAMHCYVIVRVR